MYVCFFFFLLVNENEETDLKSEAAAAGGWAGSEWPALCSWQSPRSCAKKGIPTTSAFYMYAQQLESGGGGGFAVSRSQAERGAKRES